MSYMLVDLFGILVSMNCNNHNLSVILVSVYCNTKSARSYTLVYVQAKHVSHTDLCKV